MSDSQYLCLKNIISLCIGVLFLFSFETTFAEQSEIELQYTSDSLDKEGKILFENYQYEEAVNKFKQALEIDEKLGRWKETALKFNSIGKAYHALSQYNKALAYYDSSLVIMKEIKNRFGEGTALDNIGLAYWALSQYDKALTYYDSALVIAREVRNRGGEGTTLDDIGRVCENIGDIEKAISYYKESIEVKESIRKELKREAFRASYIEAEKDVYERLIILLIMLEQYEEAFDYMERSRSENLRRAFEQGEMVAFDPSLRRELERINFLEMEIEGLQKRLRNEKIEKEDFEKKLNELEGKLNQKLLDLKTYHPQLYNIMEPQRRTLKYIQKTIPKNTMFLEFVLVEDKYVVFLFTKDIFLAKSIAETRERIDTLVIKALNSVKSRADIEELDEYYRELYNIVIKPIENEIKEYPNVVIIPYGALYYLPFHALKRKNEKRKLEYFIEWKRVSYLPSASFLTELMREKELAEKDLLAFGNADGTLPSAEIEVDIISRIFSQSSIFKNERASKERFLEFCGDYRLLHLATHGKLDTDPRFSYIVLAPPDVGNLTVREILGLSGQFKRSSLVTLSACNTAVEKEPKKAGMELTTLSNAFKVAGVPSIVASLWEVADRSTAILMKDFYNSLKKENVDKLDALRQAQINMIKNPKYSHPFYWAPFILIGDWRLN